MSEALRRALGADRGIVCIVGAGGKKSLQQALATGFGGRLLLTASARTTAMPEGLVDAHYLRSASASAPDPSAMPPLHRPDRAQRKRSGRSPGCRETAESSDFEGPGDSRWIPACAGTTACDAPASAAGAPIAALGIEHSRLALTGPEFRPGRYEGLAPALIAELHASLGIDLTLVKADGARMRWLKGPAEDEPAMVPGAALMLPVLSLRALGRPLDEKSAHRPERVAAITGTAAGAEITEDTFARLMTHPEGSLRGRGDAYTVPVLNMVEPDQEALARRIAGRALAATTAFDRVLLARLKDPSSPWWRIVAR